MKLLITILTFSLIMLSANSNERNSIVNSNERFTTDDALITGKDPYLCGCCKGYYIKIDKVIYRFLKYPKDSDLDMKKIEYPISVRVEWKKIEGCVGDEIEIRKMRKK